MTQPQNPPADEAINRAAAFLAQAMAELQQQALTQSGIEAAQGQLAASRALLEDLAHRLERQLTEEREQRVVLAGQLTSLAASLERLVGHLQGLSVLMTEMMERVPAQAAPAPPAPAPAPEEPAFRPGGEGMSLALAGVPGFQALMDIQKALIAMEPVAGVSVERFQEGDSRVLVHLKASIKGTDLANALRSATGHAFAIEESRPELQRLRLKLIPATSA